MMDYEKSVASFRTIVSDLSDQEFSVFQDKINEVAKDSKKSSIDVAQSFEKIAGLNAKFAETADGLGAVSLASITLSKASGDDLGTSAENLVGIMNQFSMGALEADRAINVLAAGQAVGASTITQTSESFKNFGSVAAGANISLEQSVGLIQTLGKFSVFGAEAGTKLRGSILKLQQAGVGYASGQFNINDALTQAKAKIDKLKTAKKQDAALTKMFGAENISTGRILLANIELYKQFTAGVTGTNEAQNAASINSQTLTVAIDELKNSWVNMLTSSNEANSALDTAKKITRFLTRNLETIVSIGSKVVMFFAAWRALLWGAQIAMAAYNIALGIHGALSGVASIAIGKNAIALGAYNAILGFATVKQYALNLAMSLNPVAAVVLAVMALVAALGLVIDHYTSIEAFHKRQNDAKRAQGIKDEAQAVRDAAASYEKFGRTKEEAQKLALRDAQQNLLADIESVNKKAMAASTDSERRVAEGMLANIEGRKAALSGEGLATKSIFNDTSAGTALINPKSEEQQALIQRMEEIKKQTIAIDINDKGGNATVTSDNSIVTPNLTSTQSFKR
jgi:TP901 family phage tail tape measure protein